MKIESQEAFICTLDECNDKIVDDSGSQNALNFFTILVLLILV